MINKDQLIDMVSENIREDVAVVSPVIEETLQIIQSSLERGEDINLADFGRFRLKTIPASKVKSPISGETYETSKHYGVSFRPATKFKDKIKTIPVIE